MMPPESVQRSAYWICPARIRTTSRETIRCTSLPAAWPRTWISPMCERSKSPAACRTARCSSRIEEYWSGMAQPPKLVIWACRRRCSSYRGVRSMVVAGKVSRS